MIILPYMNFTFIVVPSMMFQNHRTRRTYRDNFARPMSLHRTVSVPMRTLHIFYKCCARPNETAREGI